MSLGSSDMARAALGTAFSLLLLASIIQGLQEVERLQYERMEAVVGQNVTLLCTIKKSPDLKIVSIEWRKNKHESTKLALYNPDKGLVLFWPNVTMQVDNTSMCSSLQLYGVTTQDSGIYVCDMASFPLGSIWRETVLEIKDDIKCDVESAVEVHSGENVTIKCRLIPDAKYKWTKNKALVSDNESLELWCVADAHTGVYTLTVSTGNQSLQKEFIITVLTATTSLNIDLVTVPPQSNVTEEGLSTSATTGLSTTDTNVTWTMNMSTDVKDENPNSKNVSAEEHMTSLTNPTHVSIHPTHDSNTVTLSDQSVAFNLSTTLSYGNKVFRSTYETTNESMEGNPGASPTLSTGNTTIVIEDEGDNYYLAHTFDPGCVILLLSLIIVPILVLIAAAGFLYLRQIRKKRMDLPPPFKPPPPPVKYTAARHHAISTQHSRCDSVMEPKDMKQMCINV
uniref:Ig-like domain-containing protein n=1 Tax=Cyclopterus lumpus TaxID=8103 RepID=A0A8C2Z7T0_CYCLU